MRIWHKLAIAGLVSGGLVLGSFPGLAGAESPRIDNREAYQQGRIYQGVESGQITPREFNRLENQQSRIQTDEARMQADGRYNRRERVRTQQRLNSSNCNIYRGKHNNRSR